MSGGKLDKETVQRIVEGKLTPGEIDPAQQREYERAAKVKCNAMFPPEQYLSTCRCVGHEADDDGEAAKNRLSPSRGAFPTISIYKRT